jgi:hypothetical protein
VRGGVPPIFILSYAIYKREDCKRIESEEKLVKKCNGTGKTGESEGKCNWKFAKPCESTNHNFDKSQKKKTIKHYLRNAPLFFFTLGKYVIVCTHPQISLGKSSQGE